MIKELKKWVASLRSKKADPYFYRSGWELGGDSGLASLNPWPMEAVESSSKEEKKMDERIAKKPVEVYNELVSEAPEINMANLDGQIALVKRRLRMFEELSVSAGDEKEALGFLEARKKAKKGKPSFRWAVTTHTMIQDLLKKYKLAYVDFGMYAKNVPMEAIDELEAFCEEYSKVRDDKPVLRLIIDDAPAPGEKVSKERKKDPILLASSPFGKFFYILGAWDKEVQVVDELVYHGK